MFRGKNSGTIGREAFYRATAGTNPVIGAVLGCGRGGEEGKTIADVPSAATGIDISWN
ncbi:hypothetical protein K9N68_08485 [Kovacikia minuta CCNUW1]|uniref:hypothetical protein n=1 Tax=Kovacikia minuta TaxID=2931930 RepID=UPI001CCF962A|nr:hypothetical protein [Kovacikia minuta]UBF27919.1 hypothetical protein K9N68_08485 [Kovacikia minuta CCNUW1]